MKIFLLLYMANLSLNLNTQVDPWLYDMIGIIKGVEGVEGVVSNRNFQVLQRLNKYSDL